MVRTAGPAGICEPELATMTLEVDLGSLALFSAGAGFRLTHATDERIIVPTATSARFLRGAVSGGTSQHFARVTTLNIPRLMVVNGDCYGAAAI
jgi:hypothetical protein